MKKERPILLVDAMNLFVRHFVANPSMSSKGEPAGGLVGFLRNLQNVVSATTPSRVIVIWEGGGSQRKRKIFPDYKSKRRPQKLNRFYDEDIPNTVGNRNWQIETIISTLRHVPVQQIYVDNCEADDVIGYLCKNTFNDVEKVILSSDKDFYQLIDKKTKIYSPTSKKYIQTEDVLERFNIHPNNFCTAKAFCGDPSDNVPGIKSVGFKSLVKRFPQLSNLEDVSVSDIVKEAKEKCTEKSPKILTRIAEGEEVARRNWKLMYLDIGSLSGRQVKKIEHTCNTFEPKWDKIGLLRKLVKSGLTTFDGERFFFTFSFVLKSN